MTPPKGGCFLIALSYTRYRCGYRHRYRDTHIQPYYVYIYIEYTYMHAYTYVWRPSSRWATARTRPRPADSKVETSTARIFLRERWQHLELQDCIRYAPCVDMECCHGGWNILVIRILSSCSTGPRRKSDCVVMEHAGLVSR